MPAHVLLEPDRDPGIIQHLNFAGVGGVCTNDFENVLAMVLFLDDTVHYHAYPFNDAVQLQSQSLYLGREGDGDVRWCRDGTESINGMAKADPDKVANCVPAVARLSTALVPLDRALCLAY